MEVEIPGASVVHIAHCHSIGSSHGPFKGVGTQKSSEESSPPYVTASSGVSQLRLTVQGNLPTPGRSSSPEGLPGARPTTRIGSELRGSHVCGASVPKGNGNQFQLRTHHIRSQLPGISPGPAQKIKLILVHLNGVEGPEPTAPTREFLGNPQPLWCASQKKRVEIRIGGTGKTLP